RPGLANRANHFAPGPARFAVARNCFHRNCPLATADPGFRSALAGRPTRAADSMIVLFRCPPGRIAVRNSPGNWRHFAGEPTQRMVKALVAVGGPPSHGVVASSRPPPPGGWLKQYSCRPARFPFLIVH